MQSTNGPLIPAGLLFALRIFTGGKGRKICSLFKTHQNEEKLHLTGQKKQFRDSGSNLRKVQKMQQGHLSLIPKKINLASDALFCL